MDGRSQEHYLRGDCRGVDYIYVCGSDNDNHSNLEEGEMNGLKEIQQDFLDKMRLLGIEIIQRVKNWYEEEKNDLPKTD